MTYRKHPDTELLQAALVGYQHQRAILSERIAEITEQLGGRTLSHGAVDGAKPKRVMSAGARRSIAAAQRKRWAEFHKASGTSAKKVPTKAKRQMSTAGRKRIAEATRKRWAAYRVAKAATAN